MSWHLNYTPYCCTFCSYSATKPQYVTLHIRYKHRDVPSENRLCHFNPDYAMEAQVDSAYYSVSVDKHAEKDAPRLQQATYDAVSLQADTVTAASQCSNSLGIQSPDANSASSGALKITLIRKTKEPNSIHGKRKFYRCKHCIFVASNRKFLNIHMSKMHKIVELRCFYCSASIGERYDMFIHWYANHKDLPFRYQRVVTNGTVVDVRTQAVTVQAMVSNYLSTLSEFDNGLSTVPGTEVSHSEADTGMTGESVPDTADIADENTPSPVDDDDIIYCCETCPSSFSTADALSLHNCTSATLQSQLL